MSWVSKPTGLHMASPSSRTVTVRCDQDKAIQVLTWSLTVEAAIDVLFDCKSYSEKFGSDQPNRVDFIFYGDLCFLTLSSWHIQLITSYPGLAEQTVAAAYAFEMVRFSARTKLIHYWYMRQVYNLIMTWRMQNEQAKGMAAKKFVAHSSGSCRN